MTGKAGILHLHLGDGPRGLDAGAPRARRERAAGARLQSDPRQPQARAVRRSARARAARLAVDITAFPVDERRGCLARPPKRSQRYLGSGAPRAAVTVSSDAGGCLPCFDADGQCLAHGRRRSAGALLDDAASAAGARLALDDGAAGVHDERRDAAAAARQGQDRGRRRRRPRRARRERRVHTCSSRGDGARACHGAAGSFARGTF